MSTNIFIDENIKLVRIEIIALTEMIISYNYIPLETLKRFNKFLFKEGTAVYDDFYADIYDHLFF